MTTTGSARALVLREARHLEPTTFDLPELGDDDGILRIEACGLCGTDHEQWSGHISAAYPYIPGHEIVGTIEAVGPAAAARDRKSTRLNSSHVALSRMPSSA